MANYIAVRDHAETGNNEIIYNGKAIPHVLSSESAQDVLMWGYPGTGPLNTARSIMEHATDISNKNIDIPLDEYQNDFRKKYLIAAKAKSGDDGWKINHAEVIRFLKQQEPQ